MWKLFWEHFTTPETFNGILTRKAVLIPELHTRPKNDDIFDIRETMIRSAFYFKEKYPERDIEFAYATLYMGVLEYLHLFPRSNTLYFKDITYLEHLMVDLKFG